MIPLIDLKAQYNSIREEINAAIQSALDKGAFIGGEEVTKFETEFAAYCGAKACAGVGNGTDALYLTLKALGIGAGDEVITVSHTFIATAEAISLVGASPVFMDVREDTMLMNPEAVEAAITPRTRALIPVHLYGQPCEMDKILAVAERHGLKVIQDAAQAHGALWKGRPLGVFGDAACFSFYPGKNLGAYGDGGAVVSRDENLIRKIRMLANHGRISKHTHEFIGINSRLDAMQAATLRVKLRYLDSWNDARRRHAAYYRKALDQVGDLRLPSVHPDATSVWHLFVIRAKKRNELRALMKEKGIDTGAHYLLPVHRQPAYRYLEIPEGNLKITEKIAGEVLSLPLYPELSEEQLEAVIQTIAAVSEKEELIHGSRI